MADDGSGGVFCSQQGRQFLLSRLQVTVLPLLNVSNAIPRNKLNNNFVTLRLPLSLEEEVLVALNGIIQLLLFLF